MRHVGVFVALTCAPCLSPCCFLLGGYAVIPRKHLLYSVPCRTKKQSDEMAMTRTAFRDSATDT